MLSFQDLDETSSHSGAYSGFCPGGGLKFRPKGKNFFGLAPPGTIRAPP